MDNYILEDRNVVELRNGKKYLLAMLGSNHKFNFIDLDNVMDFSFDYYDEYLKCNKKYEIMKIYKDYTCKELLWERKEFPKLTDDEKVILRNIDEGLKYIARDKNGNLAVSDAVLYKKSTYWDCDSMINIFPFNYLFQFIQWTNTEPYSIKELLDQIPMEE